ncbi:MAG: trehalose-6-phosphate synthase [Actinobacteria bacterium]|nr:trehalose-6-phosphate synthase [Actinomycetota bacterium]
MDASARPVLVASNRGPYAFRVEAGRTVGARGAGGLSSALGDVVRSVGGTWFAAAMSQGDREVARASGGLSINGIPLRYLEIDPATFDGYYNGIANRVLWFCHHALWDLPYAPAFGAETREAWSAYLAVNRTFVDALLTHPDAARAGMLLQDYHLCAAPAMLRERGASAISHFTHIPFAPPASLRVLPDEIRLGILEGMLGADVVGFHAARWASNFLDACREVPGARVDGRRRRVRWQEREVLVEVNPISIDGEAMRGLAARDEVRARREGVRAGAELLIVRADRMELSKNVVRGFAAYARLLESHPEWHGRVRFLAHVYPSREAIPEYAAYAEACEGAAARVNERFADQGWEPVELIVRDDFQEVLAAYLDYDVLLVNPVLDGMNLVAKEGPAVNERDGVLVLSTGAGAFDELGRHALAVNAFDVEGTAQALHAALSMAPAERRRRAHGLRRAIESRTPRAWADAQLAALPVPS